MATEKKNVPATLEDILAQLSVDELKAAIAKKQEPAQGSPLVVGGKVFIHTVTYAYIGKVEAITDQEVVLSNGGWVADTGRFGEFLTKNKPNEFEKVVDNFSVARGSIVSSFLWKGELPSATI